MSIDEIIDFVRSLGGVLVLQPEPGDGTPEIAWGDTFFCYAPEASSAKTQPFATIVTKDYPDDEGSRLYRPGAFRLNIGAGTEAFTRWTGYRPKAAPLDGGAGAADVFVAHPVYGRAGWLAVVNPGSRTEEPIRELLPDAHERARSRHRR